MSWEVLTMRSAKSFFNGAIARSDLRRYWPVLFLYVGLWLLFLPIPVWNRAAERNPALAAPSRHASGNRTWNAALAVMVSRYFSKKMAHRTMRKYPLRSASFSATGVAMSPGSSVMAAEAAVEAAVSSSTVVCFS